ncbi:hypothetical protein GCM10010328_56370 [Streptomyces rubiginosohelvolus]|uniref:Uncharacterized protein n=1 Tax=Streptomyces rubiginosohelvolus TaxID=67362 RepID=A0ABQ3C913_9ACTN|nr:hypothetical protein GCM10010328_56370 [Streptomyces pluricolorescens]
MTVRGEETGRPLLAGRGVEEMAGGQELRDGRSGANIHNGLPGQKFRTASGVRARRTVPLREAAHFTLAARNRLASSV